MSIRTFEFVLIKFELTFGFRTVLEGSWIFLRFLVKKKIGFTLFPRLKGKGFKIIHLNSFANKLGIEVMKKI